MLIKNMQLGWTTVNDIKKARSFFEDTLGLQATEFNQEYGWLELQAEDQGFTLGIGQKTDQSTGKMAPGHNIILTMTVDDIVEARKQLSSKGVKFINDIYEVPGHVKMADFEDDDGNLYQLVQRLS